ncbi:MAG: SDR family NAD(P)-dependent oxidoreductase [Xanthomonadaceae bacterium]|nr:SDR family NAD(P)-dependent oxidoreductase [Xanthomonadaceae bacterium]
MSATTTTPESTELPLLLIAGYATGLGAATAARFAAAGYRVLALSRHAPDTEIPGGLHRVLDLLADDAPAQLHALLARHGTPRVVLHQPGLFRRGRPEALSEADFVDCWRGMVLSAQRLAAVCLPAMVRAGGGSLLVAGATASLRGGAEFAAFASAKFALRGLTQALARAYQPQGVHVAHVILDGILAGSERIAAAPDAPRLQPHAVAAVLFDLAAQGPGAWTHELDLRAAGEPF